jgi:arylsulfatase A-like enzyme
MRVPARRGNVASALSIVVGCLLAVGIGTPARAQLDCADIDHDCHAESLTARGIKRAGGELVRCVRRGISPCDLTEALLKVTSPDCKAAIECQLRELFDDVGDASTDCVQRLFKEGYKFMSKKAMRIDREQNDKIPEDLVKCKERGGLKCIDPIAPPLTDACAGNTTPTDGATCICDVADQLSNDMLLTPATCALPQAAAAAPADPTPPLAERAVGRPNLILILTDDQRFDTVGLEHARDATCVGGANGGAACSANSACPGGSCVGTTPVMPNVVNELVNSGVTFPNGFVTTALCCPSRASILTGQYAHNTGIHTNGGADGGYANFDDTSTIGLWLRDAGYRTGFVGKYLNGYATGSPCIPPGWDDWHVFVQVKFYDYDFNDNGVVTRFGTAPEDYSQTILTQRALQFIQDAHDAHQLFFLYFAPKAPHGPATPRPDHIGLFAGIADWRPPNYALAPTNGPQWVQSLTWTTNNMDSTDNFRIDQLESLQAVDEGVRDIMQKLRDLGEDDNTLVVFSSDNGFSWGSHKWRPKQCPYQECMRVPMIMRPPGGTTARIDARPVLNIDFAPTLVELAAATVPSTHVVNGASVVPILAGGAAPWRNAMLNEHWNGTIPTNGLVKQGRCSVSVSKACKKSANCPAGESCLFWKYVEYVTGETELYKLTTDPFELTNVASDRANATLKRKLASKLHQLQAD